MRRMGNLDGEFHHWATSQPDISQRPPVRAKLPVPVLDWGFGAWLEHIALQGTPPSKMARIRRCFKSPFWLRSRASALLHPIKLKGYSLQVWALQDTLNNQR
eukprot:s549_g7.t1